MYMYSLVKHVYTYIYIYIYVNRRGDENNGVPEVRSQLLFITCKTKRYNIPFSFILLRRSSSPSGGFKDLWQDPCVQRLQKGFRQNSEPPSKPMPSGFRPDSASITVMAIYQL